MKKFSKIGKRVLAFFLVALMNINTYAAVGGNDGSAFVTKAEFDALVNTFNEQMDTYEDSIVTKIDGAIANYLSGLSNYQIVSQSSIINRINMPFINGWNLKWSDNGTSCNLGNKMRLCINISVCRALDGYNYNRRVNPSVSGRCTWSWFIGTSAWEKPAFKTVGSTNSRYVLYKNSAWDPTYKTISGLMASYPMSSYIATSYSTWDAPNREWVNSTYTPGVDQSIIVGAGTKFDSLSESRSWNMYGRSDTVQGTKQFLSNDTIITSNMSGYMSGNSVPTTVVYAVDVTKLDEKMTTYRLTGTADQGFFMTLYDNANTGVNKRDDAFSKNYKIAGYEHNYSTIEAGTGMAAFVVDNVSLLMDEPVHYYSGLPIFTANLSGVANVALKFVNNETQTSTFEIKEGKFTDNGPFVTGVSKLVDASCYYIDDEGNTIRNVYTIPSGKVLNVQFAAEKDKTYWIKVNPTKSNSYTTITSEDITITTE